MTSAPGESPISKLSEGSSPSLPPQPLPRLLPRWLWGLAGICLFLSGAILGAVLMASVTLYQLPAASTVHPSSTPAAPTATLPVLQTIAPTIQPSPTRPPIGPGIGQQAPDFILPGLDGLTYTLSAQEDRTVILSFWASWCPPCRQEWPALLTFTASLNTTETVFLSVNVEEIPEMVWKFVGTSTLPFPVLLDQDGQVSERYRVTALPTTFILDPSGRVRHVLPGPLDIATLQRLIQP